MKVKRLIRQTVAFVLLSEMLLSVGCNRLAPPSGVYNVGLSKMTFRNFGPEVFLNGIDLTDKETVILVEYVDNDRDETIPHLEGAGLEESMPSHYSYTFLRSEPLTYKEDLSVKKGERIILKFYFERLKGNLPKELEFRFGTKGGYQNYGTYFTLKKIE